LFITDNDVLFRIPSQRSTQFHGHVGQYARSGGNVPLFNIRDRFGNPTCARE
jgi:hypothetical protein